MQTNPDTLKWLALSQAPGIGIARIKRWLNHFGDLKTLLTATEKSLHAANLLPKEITTLKTLDWKSAESNLTWAEKNNCHLIPFDHPNYPVLLRETSGCPLILYVLGHADLLNQPQLAIVGSRNPTPQGKQNAEQFSGALARSGLVITSGMALGIDAASHRGALTVNGKTIAVAGSGLKHIYPKSHQKLSEEIITNGALVSEFPPDVPPRAPHFPLRNRIISGMSLGVLVIEAALKSGSLITTRFALEQNREIFAMPGSIHNPLAKGCHQLLREGAKLVETPSDILEELNMLHAALIEGQKTNKLDENQSILLKNIGHDPTSLDQLIQRSGLTKGQVSSMLLSLELEGYVGIVPGGYVSLTK